jgi:hypothetical protein
MTRPSCDSTGTGGVALDMDRAGAAQRHATAEFRWDREFADSPLEESGFELMVPPRTERKWEGARTHQHHLGRTSELKVPLSFLPNLSSDTWDQEFDPFPPAVSPVRTTGSGATAPGTARELRSYLVTRVPNPGM